MKAKVIAKVKELKANKTLGIKSKGKGAAVKKPAAPAKDEGKKKGKK